MTHIDNVFWDGIVVGLVIAAFINLILFVIWLCENRKP